MLAILLVLLPAALLRSLPRWNARCLVSGTADHRRVPGGLLDSQNLRRGRGFPVTSGTPRDVQEPILPQCFTPPAIAHSTCTHFACFFQGSVVAPTRRLCTPLAITRELDHLAVARVMQKALPGDEAGEGPRPSLPMFAVLVSSGSPSRFRSSSFRRRLALESCPGLVPVSRLDPNGTNAVTAGINLLCGKPDAKVRCLQSHSVGMDKLLHRLNNTAWRRGRAPLPCPVEKLLCGRWRALRVARQARRPQHPPLVGRLPRTRNTQSSHKLSRGVSPSTPVPQRRITSASTRRRSTTAADGGIRPTNQFG
jgi:hypothetical protein